MPTEEPVWKTRPLCDLDQLVILKRCSEKKDVTEWNIWRRKNVNTEVWLQGASLRDAHLEGAVLLLTHLEGAELWDAHLEGAVLREAHLEGAVLRSAHLEGAELTCAYVDDLTNLFGVSFDRETAAECVALDRTVIEPKVLQCLQYNERKANWETWYGENCLHHWPVRLFWSMSDYGRSGKRVLGWFFGLALAFGLVYFLCALKPPGIVEGLIPASDTLSGWMLLLRSIYFSVVTMTTLGFGDIYAHPQSVWGHLLLMLQVILGYVLLGALVTRFAVMFTAGGPAAEFPEDIRRRQRWKRKLLSPRRWKRRALRLAATLKRLRRIREGSQCRWPRWFPQRLSRTMRLWTNSKD